MIHITSTMGAERDMSKKKSKISFTEALTTATPFTEIIGES